jgi:hypothetical protein
MLNLAFLLSSEEDVMIGPYMDWRLSNMCASHNYRLGIHGISKGIALKLNGMH